MKTIDAELTDNPTQEMIIALVELGIRNKICWDELASFNKKGVFLNKHPYLNNDNQRVVLSKTLKNDISGFMEEYRSATNNITRYTSYLNRKNIKPADKVRWGNALKKHEESKDVIIELIYESCCLPNLKP